MTREEFFHRLSQLRTHKYRGKRAPNKPLLLLLALGRVVQGYGRLVSYKEVERHLGALLRRFGPPRKRVHPEFPFGRLRSDGLWEIPGDSALSTTSKGDLLAGEMKQRNVKGGFPEGLQILLEADPELVSVAVQFLLNEHFPFSLHDEIRQATGVPAWSELRLHQSPGRRKVREVLRRDRDPAFRVEVLHEYEEHCAVCDFEIRLNGELLGLEAAHIQWHSHEGPDRVSNGLALCMLHHKALDRGALGLERRGDGFEVLVSSQVGGRRPSTGLLIDVAGKLLRPPRSSILSPDPEHVAWHREEVFRDPPLAS